MCSLPIAIYDRCSFWKTLVLLWGISLFYHFVCMRRYLFLANCNVRSMYFLGNSRCPLRNLIILSFKPNDKVFVPCQHQVLPKLFLWNSSSTLIDLFIFHFVCIKRYLFQIKCNAHSILFLVNSSTPLRNLIILSFCLHEKISVPCQLQCTIDALFWKF